MADQLKQVKWVRVIITTITTIIVFVAALLAYTLVVTVYAGYIGFQAQGAPDQNMINEFASKNAPLYSSIFFILFTYIGARHVAQRVEDATQTNALAVGALGGLAHIVTNFSDILSLSVLPVGLLAVVAGWLAGRGK